MFVGSEKKTIYSAPFVCSSTKVKIKPHFCAPINFSGGNVRLEEDLKRKAILADGYFLQVSGIHLKFNYFRH